jgi:hypothetical protein
MHHLLRQLHINKNFSKAIPSQKYFKQGGTLSPLLFNVAVRYSMANAHERKERMELNGQDQLPVCSGDINLLVETQILTKTQKL